MARYLASQSASNISRRSLQRLGWGGGTLKSSIHLVQNCIDGHPICFGRDRGSRVADSDDAHKMKKNSRSIAKSKNVAQSASLLSVISLAWHW
jgi:hypothetical protein